MKNVLTAGVLTAALLFASACSSTGTANKVANTTITTNTASSPTQSAISTNTATTANSSNATQSSPSEKGGKQDFALVNATNVEINSVYISPHDKDNWEEDILGRDTLPNGERVNIKFNRDEKPEMWDLRVEDSKGNSIEWENLNLLEISKVTLHYENGRATAETE